MRINGKSLLAAVMLAAPLGCVLAATPAAPAPAAGPGLAPLAAKQHCDECHAISEARIGPPFLAVASRYAGEGDAAVERLARKIINGGAGNWGNIPMVPNERVGLEDARSIARWILTLRAN